MSGRILQAQKLATSFDPFEDDRPARPARAKPLPADLIERGAIAIYGTIIRAKDDDEAAMKWAEKAKESNRQERRAEAEACLRAAGRL
ncbi:MULTISPECIES: hypothetical protein [unclassified Aureimonas]|uniref:hypothetical protein n=1 Tax=unclassified Aureimonas TaxID=2615206 RepID=UPI0006F749BD|nr:MULTISPECIES: hypothetical protein [unclassified Aureimonas]KQT52180.1 hypothetical protein ASG62_16105 [Aureimonas sp. Leaf427]KQT70587.1 hypothetical protein ASG54_21845 [Aureimonas sp. Leaf460]